MAYTTPGETRRQVYQFMRERLLAGEPPSLRELQDAFGFRSIESGRSHLRRLVEEGLLVKHEGCSRGYRLADETPPPALVPLLGGVQAGDLQAALEDPDGFLQVAAPRAGDELFALRVRGESMTGVGILPDDIVIARRQSRARTGDIVVALVDDEATVKTLVRQRNRWVLRPENPDFQPIVPPPRALRLLGKVVEVRRYFGGVPMLDPLP